MAVPPDSVPKFEQYARPGMLVTTEWVAEHLGGPGVVVAESDEDVLLYETGHIPGAVKLDWHTELNDPVTRDYVDGAGFARLMSGKGITRDTTLVVYGDKNNWWAAYALCRQPVRAPGPAAGRRRPGQVDRRGAPADQGGAGAAPDGLPGHRARRHPDPRVPGPGAGPPRQAADRRALAR